MWETKARREYLHFYSFISISLIGFALFYIYPFARTVYLSFTDRTITNPIYRFVGFQNYVKALYQDDLLHHSLWITFKYAIIVGPLQMLISLSIALLLNSKLRGMGIYRTIFFMPFIIPSFAVAFVFQWFFQPTKGLVNGVLAYFGIQGPGWYADSSTALYTLIIASLWGFGVTMVIFLGALQGVQKDLYEVADIDGASRLQKFLKITFPEISPVFLFNAILTTIGALRSFDLAFLIGEGNGYPANSTLLYSVYLFNEAFRPPYQLGYASTIALVFFFILLMLTGLNFLLGKIYVKTEG